MEHGIKPTAPSDNATTEQHHQAVIDSLRARSGANFDREYITEAIIDHRVFIALVSETLLPTVKEPALAAHPKEVLPAFKKHLAMTIEASRKLDIPAKMIMEEVRVLDRSLCAASNPFDGAAELVSVQNRDGPRRKSDRTASC
jgi:hypothetical protein